MPQDSLIVQPGDLRKPIQLLTRVDSQSITGGENPPTFPPLFNYAVFAKDTHRHATARDAAGKLVTTVYHEYTVHYHPSIVAGIYIQDPDFTNLMYVQGVTDPDGERHWQLLVAEDVEG